MNKSLAKFLIHSTVTITGTMGLWLGISLVTLGQNIVAQEIESDSSNSALAEAEELNQQANKLYQQGKYSEAIPLLEQLLAITREKFGDNHPYTATFLNNLADLYRLQGKYTEAETLLKQALAIRREQLGDNNPDTVVSFNNLAALYQLQGKFSEAEPLYKKTLAIRRKQLGDKHPDTAISLNDLANLYLDQGRYPEAELLYQQALAIRRKQLGENHPDTAISLNNLALLYQEQGKYTEAEPLFQQSLAIRLEKLGENHLDTATATNNLAELYRAQGRFSEAEPLFQQALAITRKQLGHNNLNTAIYLNNLALLYRDQGRYTKAKFLFQQALAIKREKLGDNHLGTATSINNLALLYHVQGRYTKAQSLYQQALAIRQKQLGENHPDTATSFHNLANLYLDQGRYKKAESLFQKALAIIREKLGDNHPDTVTSVNNLADLYLAQGRYTEAEPLYQQALAIRREKLGDNHPDTATSINNLADLYLAQGRYTEAEPLYQQALAIRREKLGDNHPDTAFSLNDLANPYLDQGRYTEAEPLFQQALAIAREQLGDNHPDTAGFLNNLAELYRLQERFSKAEPLYQQALTITRKQLGDNHPDTAISLNNLALLYRLQGRFSEAEPLYQQALAIRREQLGDNHSDTAGSLNNLANLYLDQGNINLAIELLTQGIKVEEYNLSENLIAGSEQQKRDYIATISPTSDYAISLNLKSASNNPDATKLALTTILQRKGRILDVLTNSLQILRQQTDDSKTQDLLTQLIALRTQYSNLVFLQPEDIKSPDIHRQQLIELETQTKQLEDQLSRRSAKFRNLSEPITLEKIQQLIPDNSALVELVRYQPFNPQATKNQDKFGKPHYAAYILRSQGQPQAIDLGEAEPIDKAIDQFRQNLCTQTKTAEDTQYCLNNLPITQVKSSAQNLEQMVMQPVRQLLGKTTNILLSPDGKLNLVPFEALVDNQNQYLVENYNFTYLTSGRDLIRLQQKSPSQEQPLVMADPLYNQEANLAASQLTQRSIEDISELFNSKSFPRLEATEKEAQAIQSLLSLPSDRLKLQSQASETLLKQVQSPQLLHIATHGFFLDRSSETNSNQASPNQINDNPLLRSGLVLAGVESRPSQVKSENDGVFTAYEASFLDLVGTKLVVLSACDTGVGETTSGEGIYGLRRALVIAGSESQLISLWKVADNGTKDLMTAYYQTLKQSEGRTTALHEVQRQMLRGKLKGEKGQSYEHPYYWASFIPSGDWTSMEFNRKVLSP
jgi:tetratricopeptide (TPR) repeat protein